MAATLAHVDMPRRYDPANLHSEGTLRGLVLSTLLERQGVTLERGRLLDLGCGYGGLSIHAARRGAAVTAVDTSTHKLETLAHRIAAERWPPGASLTALSASATSLPFETGTFDSIVTLGVIEWVPLGEPGPDPRAIQVQALAEIARVLEPGGTYVLGTKNRWFPINLVREPQVRWPLVNHLPRGAARAVAGTAYGRDYRTYVHSLDDWQAMLSEAGFRSVRALLPVYFYQFPIDLWPVEGSTHDLDRSESDAAAWIPQPYLDVVRRGHPAHKRALLKLVIRARLERLLWPAFMFLAQR
ncbi:MAG: methyltransferase domain-containing protein [Chloroflexi bacterium]|nr:methyltransferase domain-containing protein [Chloroflexota bacterium]